MNETETAKYPPGPWTDEPDELQWEHAGLTCAIRRNPHGGHLCGYVGVPSSHPDHGKDYDDVMPEVHGGLTYADDKEGYPVKHDGLWWFGFDCAHCDDYQPFWRMDMGGEYRDIEYVKAETNSLAEQLAAAAKGEGKD